MNEDYLKQFRKPADASLVEKIHLRLRRKERMQVIRRYSVYTVLLLGCTFGLLMTLSKTVRAQVLQTIEELAGLRFDVTSDYPGDSGGDEAVISSEYLSLAEAQDRFPSPVVQPTYVPSGYQRKEDVILTPFEETPTLMMIWVNQEGQRFWLDILHCPTRLDSCGFIVGDGALEEISLNGNPAVVVHGSWNYDTQQYDVAGGTAIRWKYDDTTIYTLSTWKDLSLEELIRIAESIH